MRGFTHWSPQETRQLIAKFNAGEAAAQIADQLGRGIKGVQRRLRQLKMTNWDVKRRWESNDDAQLIMAVNAGKKLAQIANDMNRTICSIRNRIKFLRNSGAPLPPAQSAQLRNNENLDDNPLSPWPPTESAQLQKNKEWESINCEDLAWMERYRQQRLQRLQRISNDAQGRL